MKRLLIIIMLLGWINGRAQDTVKDFTDNTRIWLMDTLRPTLIDSINNDEMDFYPVQIKDSSYCLHIRLFRDTLDVNGNNRYRYLIDAIRSYGMDTAFHTTVINDTMYIK